MLKIVFLSLFLFFCGQAKAQHFDLPLRVFTLAYHCYVIDNQGDSIDFRMKQFIWKDDFMIGISGTNQDAQEFVIYANDISFLAVQNAGYATKRRAAQPQYVYFQAKHLEKEGRFVLLQLLNPNNSQAIKCYFDPKATPVLSKNNFQNVNSNAYYIDNGTTFQRYEKHYFFAEAKKMFNYCERMGSFLAMEWDRLPQYLAQYQEKCY